MATRTVGTRAVQSFSPEKLKALRLDPKREGGPLRGERLAEALKGATLPGRRTLSRSAISDYEAGTNAPEPWALVQVATALGVRPRDLCDVEEGAETITNLREWAGISKADAQKAFGWNSQPYKNWEDGLAHPPSWRQHQVLAVAAKMFGVEKTDVLRAWQMSGNKPRPIASFKA